MIVRNTDFGFSGGKLDFSWDEVHEIAEQLEHIKSKTD
jgi:Mn-dependent DtxR family transcriptional regulator